MRDTYITSNWMGREELLYNRLVEGFNLPPIAARAVVELSMDVLLDDNKTPGGLGQIRYIAISAAEDPREEDHGLCPQGGGSHPGRPGG